jgi:hypothetical protein
MSLELIRKSYNKANDTFQKNSTLINQMIDDDNKLLTKKVKKKSKNIKSKDISGISHTQSNNLEPLLTPKSILQIKNSNLF